MRVLCDFHHDDLFWSQYLLWEKRLGATLFQPIGLDWKHAGYWDYGIIPAVWNQFLGDYRITGEATDGSHYLLHNHRHDIDYRGLTLEQFKANPTDIVISSTTGNDDAVDKLVREVAPKALHIAHVGNIGQWTHVRHVLLTTNWVHPSYRSYVQMHQEFDLDVYQYKPPPNHNSITSFVNIISKIPECWKYYTWLEAAMPEFRFSAYGIANPGGIIDRKQEIARLMSESAFGFHVKPGDGYGHSAHHWYACGRPLIVNMSVYRDLMAGRLLVEDVTCINVEGNDVPQKIRHFAEPERHARMCEAAYKRFKEVVDFDAEAARFQHWLGEILP